MEFVVYLDLVCTRVSEPVRSDFYDLDRGKIAFYRECSFGEPTKTFDDDKSYVRDIRVFENDTIPVVGKKYRVEIIYFTDMYGELNFHVGLV